MKQKYLAVALLFTLIISIIPLVSVKATPPNADTLKIATIGNAETCDPAWSYDTASGELIFNVYEGLLGFDNEKVDAYLPLIAQSWAGSTVTGRAIIPSPPDPTRNMTLDLVDLDGDGIADPVVQTWYFKIRSNVKWQVYDTYEGNVPYVTTSDIEWSLERGMVEDAPTTVQWMFYNPLLKCMGSSDLGNLTAGYDTTPAEADANADLMGHLIENAIRRNSTHVWFNLRQPYAAFMQILAQTWACILDREWTIDPSLDTGAEDNFPGFAVTGYKNWRDYNVPDEPGPLMDELGPDPLLVYPRMMGSGPYALDWWDTDAETGSFQLVKFANYWQGWSAVCPLHPHVDKYYQACVAEWTDRKAGFIAGDYDQVAVLPDQRSDIEGAANIRYLPDLPTLAGDALFFNVDVDPTSPNCPEQPIGTKDPTFWADRYARLGFMYLCNKTLYSEEVFQGEATPIGNPIIAGIAYYNASKPYYDYNLERAIYCFKMAKGGSDPNGDGIVEPGDEGLLWTEGFKVIFVYNAGNTVRKALCDILAYNALYDITTWPADVEVTSELIAWSGYGAALRANKLSSYIIGWLADFPDPHNWVIPFMHSQGDFARYQNIDFSEDPSSLNWYLNTYGPLPYYNYKGDLVTALSNDYVDGLIQKGIGLPDTPGPYHKGDGSRNELYQELMDIFFAHAQTMMTVQALGRHYERDWEQGWLYNPIRPGIYAYDIWKQDLATQVWDVGLADGSYAQYEETLNVLVIFIRLHNFGNRPVHVVVTTCIYIITRQHVANPNLDHTYWCYPDKEIPCDLRCHETKWITRVIFIPKPLPAQPNVRIVITNWVRFDMIDAETGQEIQDQDPLDNRSPMPLVDQLTYGDLGGGIPAKFFAYDGKVDGKDKALFLLIYKGQAPWQKPDKP